MKNTARQFSRKYVYLRYSGIKNSNIIFSVKISQLTFEIICLKSSQIVLRWLLFKEQIT